MARTKPRREHQFKEDQPRFEMADQGRGTGGDWGIGGAWRGVAGEGVE